MNIRFKSMLSVSLTSTVWAAILGRQIGLNRHDLNVIATQLQPKLY